MNIIGIIQARMSSTRLQGKVMLPLRENELVIDSVYNRMCKSRILNKVIIATSTDESDDKIEQHCNNRNYPVVRGSLENVLERYYKAAKKYNADIVVRITSDCPLVDYKLNDRLIEFLIKNKSDYSGVEVGSLALGISTEVFTFNALEMAYKNAVFPHIEHVTSYMYSNSDIFSCLRMKPDIEYERSKNFRLTLDTKEDYEVIKFIFDSVKSEYITINEVVNCLNNNLKMALLNSCVVQKGVYDTK